MAELDGNQIKQIHSALKSAFPREGDLERMLAFTFNETVANIGRGEDYDDTLLRVIRWARKQSRLEELLRGAYSENPRNSQLRDIAATFLPEGAQAYPVNQVTPRSDWRSRRGPILTGLGILTLGLSALFGYIVLHHTPSDSPEATPVTTVVVVNGLMMLDANHAILLRGGWDSAWLLPDDLDPLQEPGKVLDWLKQPTNQPEPLVPLPAFEGFNYRLQITNASSSTEWLRLDNTVVSAVSTSSAPRDPVSSIYRVGGGGGNYRFFPSVHLMRGSGFYTQKIQYADFDFFTLQPGEFEEFVFNFKCAAPGRYVVTLELPYAYATTSGKIVRTGPQLMCPPSYTLWRTSYPDLYLEGTYIWDGATYSKEP